MRWKTVAKSNEGYQSAWKRWFAWHPVTLLDSDEANTVWLETVERCYKIEYVWYHHSRGGIQMLSKVTHYRSITE